MFIKRALLCSVVLCAAFPASAIDIGDSLEITGYLKSEVSFFTREGAVAGEAQSTIDQTAGHNIGDLMKWENTLKIFINGEVTDNISWHAELQAIDNTEGPNSSYRGHRLYHQNDWFRELYFDTTVGPVDLRLGKQQQVWGTADGIKLLDILNPTDFTELVETQIDESRIPVFMAVAEMNIGDTGNVQAVIVRQEENKIAGLNANPDGDSGHPFLFRGVTSITGPVNGFMVIGEAFGQSARAFDSMALLGNFAGLGLVAQEVTVQGFVSAADTVPVPGSLPGPTTAAPILLARFGNLGCSNVNGIIANIPGSYGNAACLNTIAQEGLTGGLTSNTVTLPGIGTFPLTPITINQGLNNQVTNAIDGGAPIHGFDGGDGRFTPANGQIGITVTSGPGDILVDPTNVNGSGYNANAFWDPFNPNSAFEYVADTSFATFDAFVNLNTEYRRNYPSKSKPNLGIRYKQNIGGNTNVAFNYFYAYDPNPSVSLHYEAPDGTSLSERVTFSADNTGPSGLAQSNVITLHDATGARRCSADTGIDIETSIRSAIPGSIPPNNAAIGYVFNPSDPGNPDVNGNGIAEDIGCTLVFEETVHRVHNIGASIDTAFDAFNRPFTVRGEFLYQPDIQWAVVDRGALAIGSLTNGLQPVKQDFFKYVIGVDTVFFTNLYISSQFIQFINLDFIDEPSAYNPQIDAARAFNGTRPILGTATYERYTGDLPGLHLNTNLKKAQEFKAFVSLFISKPFGPSQDGRWNNITIYEEEGGWWNRLDAEYGFTDAIVGHIQWSHYFGARNTIFGQFHNSSNVEMSLKYLFE